jgi:RND family efflux transporter MFP subunit
MLPRALSALALCLAAACVQAAAPLGDAGAMPGHAPVGAATAAAAAPAPVAMVAAADAAPAHPYAQAHSMAQMNPDVVRALIAADQETTLAAPMAGRIIELHMSLGSAFAAGDTLLAFDCAESLARAKIARAELKGARENYQAKSRLRALKAAGDVEVNLASASVDKGVGQLELSQAQAEECTVKAPFDGRVARLHVKQYQGVNLGAPLADIISDGPLKLRINAPSRWLKTLKPGMAFQVTVDETGRSYPAKVSAIGARVDAAAQAVEIEGRFDGSFPELLAGMSGTVHFPEIQ